MIEKVVITSLICLAVHVILKPGMILSIIGEWIELFLHEYLAKPLGLCLTCMASIYGTAVFLFWANLPLTDYLPFVLSVTGLNYFFSSVLTLLETLNDTNDEQNDYESQIFD